MNFVIKSVLYWFVFLVFISFVSVYFYQDAEAVGIALKQFSDTATAQSDLRKIAHRQNIYIVSIGALWCLSIAIYVNMAIHAFKEREKI